MGDLTNFTDGLSSFGVPIIGGNPDPIMGSVFFVNSATGLNANAGGSPSTAFASLDWAIGKCTANKGDVIYVMPNHAETITGVGGITADVAGITIIGLGSYDQRPRFLMDGGTTVTFVVSAADVTVRNLVFAGGHSDIVACFDVTGKGLWIDKCAFVQNTTDENFLTCVKATSTANTSDGLKVTGCYAYQIDASTAAFITLVDDIKGLVVSNNVIISEGTVTGLITCTTGKDLQGCLITWNFVANKGAEGQNLLISNDTASPNNSGIIAHNRCGHADATSTHILGAVGGCRFFDNLSCSTDAVSGFVLPAIDVNS